jgi:gamma-glutamyltranspeptidase/glutathione hydrolase
MAELANLIAMRAAMRARKPALKLALLLLLLPACPGSALARDAQPDTNPEIATGVQQRPVVRSKRYMAVAANPLASDAGAAILERGGSAVDAAIAMQMVLALVEPQSSGLGGGAFMLAWDARAAKLKTYDGRETAPATAVPERFLKDGKPMRFGDAVNSGLAVGTPGLLRMLELAHRRHGRLPWPELFARAIELAERGFAVSPRLHRQISQNAELAKQPEARAYFLPDGQPAPVGYRLKNPQLAEVLKRVAKEGSNAFYKGPIARDIIAALRSHAVPGDLTEADLSDYRAIEREPVCGNYRVYLLCGMGPPSSGGIAVLQMLGMLEQYPIGLLQPGDTLAVHYFAEAGRLAFADRELYLGDPAFTAVPVRGLLDPAYLKQRGALIDAKRSMGKAAPGRPEGASLALGEGKAADIPSTSHLVAVDTQGNAVSMTSSIEAEFGSKIFVRGFLLNNQLTDFSLAPQDEQGRPVANRIEAGKRPRSSMAPFAVFEQGKLRMVLGSPGGSAIINYVAKTLVGMIDWKLDVQQAIALPNMGSRNRDTEIEEGTSLAEREAALEAMGHNVKLLPFPSGLHAIVITPEGLEGGADPRREGAARGK